MTPDTSDEAQQRAELDAWYAARIADAQTRLEYLALMARTLYLLDADGIAREYRTLIMWGGGPR